MGGVEDGAFAAQNFEVFDAHLSGHFHPVPGLELLLFRPVQSIPKKAVSSAQQTIANRPTAYIFRGNLGDCATMPRNFTVMPL